jgi:hypothetical protein
MKYTTYTKGNYQVIRIDEVLTVSSTIDDLLDLVYDFLNKNCVKIAIVFTDGSYLISRSGAVLIQCWEAIKGTGGDLALINVNQEIGDFLSVIDFKSQIKICKSDNELE